MTYLPFSLLNAITSKILYLISAQLPDCKPEVGWMFQHLDTDGDLKLSLQELYDLENDDQEHCLRPYLLDCDVERDLVLSPNEWCSCFDKSRKFVFNIFLSFVRLLSRKHRMNI